MHWLARFWAKSKRDNRQYHFNAGTCLSDHRAGRGGVAVGMGKIARAIGSIFSSLRC
jgi:hypothetical protein